MNTVRILFPRSGICFGGVLMSGKATERYVVWRLRNMVGQGECARSFTIDES